MSVPSFYPETCFISFGRVFFYQEQYYKIRKSQSILSARETQYPFIILRPLMFYAPISFEKKQRK